MKITKGITIFTWIWLITAVFLILVALGTLSLPKEEKIRLLEMPNIKQQGISTIQELDRHFQKNSAWFLTLSAIILILVVGLFRVKEWARIGIILVSTFGIFISLSTLLSLKLLIITKPRLAGAIFGILQDTATIYFFTRKKVKEQFRYYVQPEVVDVCVNVKKINVFWKIYFWFLIIFGISGYLIEGFPRFWEVLDFAISVVSIIGLFAFIRRRKIFTRLFWKGFFYLGIIWYLYYEYFISMSDKISNKISKLDLETLAGAIFAITVLIFAIPLFIALYIYGFKSDKIWKNSV